MKARGFKMILSLLALAALIILLIGLSRSREPSYAGRSLSYWVQQLGSSSRHDMAVAALRAIGPRAVPVLAGKVTRPEPVWRKAYDWSWRRMPAFVQERLSRPRTREEMLATISSALSCLGPPAVPALIKEFSSPSKEVRQLAMAALIPMGEEAGGAVPELVRMMSDPDGEVRFTAILTLRYMGPERVQAIPALIEGLRDDTIGFAQRTKPIHVREMAAQVLGRIGPPAHAAVPELTRMLSDTNALIRAQAMRALWRIEPETNLVSQAIAEVEQASDALACKQFLSVLGEMGANAQAAVPLLRRMLTNSASLHSPTGMDLSSAARAALRKMEADASFRSAKRGLP